MANYTFKCSDCNYQFILSASIHDGPADAPNCPNCGAVARRNLRADLEGQRVHIPMHMSARNTSNKTDFLPSTKDFESPTDPTGEKGMKKWKDEHTTVGFREI